jgi:predicted site-specific integrase-resolvase
MSQPNWYNTVQAATYLGLRPCTLEKWRVHGRGPRYFKPAGRVRYDERDLAAFLADGAVDAGQ